MPPVPSPATSPVSSHDEPALTVVLNGLIERGIARVHLANRTASRSQALAEQFGVSVKG